MLLFKIFQESIAIALQQLTGNKLRTFLSLLGITIGILCIISVISAVDSLERNIRGSVSKLGDNVVYIQKWPWGPEGGTEYEWWKYWKRPVPDQQELRTVQEHTQGALAAALELMLNGEIVQYLNMVLENVTTVAVSHDLYKIQDFEFAEGRYFTLLESHRGAPIAILGHTIAEQLFPGQQSPLGKEIKFMDRKLTVIGVLEKEGEDLLSFSSDNNVLVPYNYALKIVDPESGGNSEPFIAVKAKPGISVAALKDELTGVLRAHRRLKPKEDNNFALNQVSILSNQLSSLFGVVNFAGWIIGIFAILVGGFGIANIMFVSVKERTSQIGIKKALGAKNYFILLEFLLEAIILCIIGGAIGMALVYGLTVVGDQLTDFNFVLSLGNITVGLLLSVTIGIISGFLPALRAARMKPVEAIRQV